MFFLQSNGTHGKRRYPSSLCITNFCDFYEIFMRKIWFNVVNWKALISPEVGHLNKIFTWSRTLSFFTVLIKKNQWNSHCLMIRMSLLMKGNKICYIHTLYMASTFSAVFIIDYAGSYYTASTFWNILKYCLNNHFCNRMYISS